MKIEFKKETVNGKDTYFTYCDGRFVDGSVHYDKDEAYELFMSVVENKGILKTIETIETKII